MHNPESVQENERYKIRWDFEIQMDHLLPAWWPDLAIVSKKKIVDFAVPADHRVKLKEGEKRYKYLDLAQELKNKQTNNAVWKWRRYQFLLAHSA